MGDIAGTLNPLTADQEPDGMVNEFDIIELIVLVDTLLFEPCADMDGSGTITLGPTIVNSIWYPGDIDLMFANFGICNQACQDAAGNKAFPCFSSHLGVGCNKGDCCSIVCQLEPLCCTVEWDAFCAATALEVCNNSGGSCLLTSTTPGCLDAACSKAVCTYDPDGDGSLQYAYCCELFWDRSCVEVAGEVCIDMFCAEYPFEPCPFDQCGDPFSGKCTLAHYNPGCSDGACCTLVCLVDPFCCEFTWDTACALEATEGCPSEFGSCGRGNPTNCWTVSIFQPGCNDFNCCNDVCQFDPYCCAAQWDITCAILAWEICTTYDVCGVLGTGSCRVEHLTPGCDDAGCCDQVCNIDQACCEIEWDANCVALANFQCNGCGDLASGSCFDYDNATPACNDRFCCESVCIIDSYCCSEQWDSICALIAEVNCFDPLLYCGSALARSCFTAGTSQGCDNVNCCEEICRSFDPFCCEVNWDAVCVTTALALDECQPTINPSGRGDCLEASTFPGCGITSCMASVCDVDPFCCSTSWNSICVDIAEVLCFDLVICPSEGSCEITHPDPGCENPWCCNVVCQQDPHCCEVSWDNDCAIWAINNCVGSNMPTCPCSGSCFDIHDNPGCDTEACCTAVCKYDGDGDGIPDFPECCEIEWDVTCAALATAICCTGEACGDICAGSCLETNGTPNCDDPACCSAVCAIDPFCCNVVWDGRCILLAEERCRRGCGVETSGSCFISKFTPGCSDGECCAEICQDIDPFCCEGSWDATCTVLAQLTCEAPECGDYETGDCCLVHEGPACNNPRCCDAVCALDAFCCDFAWDQVCLYLARQAIECDCSYDCGEICAGDCCDANGTPGCNDVNCCTAVCLLDIFCCTNEWDIYCAQQALTTCNGLPGSASDVCPAPQCGDKAAGGCCFANGSPSCSDETCCDWVCLTDPFCCSSEWDSNSAPIHRKLSREARATVVAVPTAATRQRAIAAPRTPRPTARIPPAARRSAWSTRSAASQNGTRAAPGWRQPSAAARHHNLVISHSAVRFRAGDHRDFPKRFWAGAAGAAFLHQSEPTICFSRISSPRRPLPSRRLPCPQLHRRIRPTIRKTHG